MGDSLFMEKWNSFVIYLFMHIGRSVALITHPHLSAEVMKG